ncbi:MAG: SDR family oxidoreductase [Sphingobacteriales bacterium]|nr:MAG: SDR family oxidoreductase [Sphingobacteriales bacterium]TAF80553.1 MAG: SDR family oxidoreductase [Sphingobacteriales bacterium]
MEKPKVLITGASKGLGLAMAELLAADYSLILHASKEENLAPATPGHYVLCADLSDKNELSTFCKRLKAEHGDLLYAVINNAGIAFDKSIIFQPEADIDKMLAVNLKAPIMIAKVAMKIFGLKKRGVIINLSSSVGETGNAFQSIYAATKAALVAFSKSLAKEAGVLHNEHQIRVLCVSPGFIQTDMTDAIPENYRQKYLEMIPAKRYGQAHEIAQTVRFLLSDNAAYINGTNIHVNGAMV